MAKKLQLSVPKPCHENWDAMTATEKGKFCGSCNKQVIDFSTMSDRELAQFFKKPSTGSVCGRFMNDQLDRQIEIPKKRIPWLKYFFQVALPALFMSRAGAQQVKMGQVARPPVKDTIQQPLDRELMTVGKLAMPACIKPVTRDTVVSPLKGEVKTIRTIQGRVVDQRGEPVAYASIETGIKGRGTVADEQGYFSIPESALSKDRKLFVSSAGFAAREIIADKIKVELLVQLQSNIILPEVVLTDLVDIRCHAIMGEITSVVGQSVVSIIPDSAAVVNNPAKDIPVAPGIKVYPNHVAAGSNLHIGIQKMEAGYYLLQLTGISGQTVKQQECWIDEDARVLDIGLPNLSAGSYFMVLLNKKTGKRFTEKIIIQ